MNPILLDFEKLFATIKNDKNNLQHLPAIEKMIDVFEKKYYSNYSVSIRLLVIYLRQKFIDLKIKLKDCA